MLKKLSLVSFCFILSCFLSPAIASEQKKVPQIGSGESVFPEALSEVTKVALEYNEFRKKLYQAKRNFNALHMDSETVSEKEPLNLAEESSLPIIVDRLADVEAILRTQTDKGYGDIDYWIRTVVLNRSIGNTCVSLLNETIANHPEMNPLLRVAINNTSENLRRICSKDLYGNIDYWTAQSRELVDALWQAASNARKIIDSIENIPAIDIKIRLKNHLAVMVVFLSRMNDEGIGNIDFWKRTAEFFIRQANIGYEIIIKSLNEAGDNIPMLLKSVIQNVANNLLALAKKYSNGYGDITYWRDAASALRMGLSSEARNITEILKSF
ncbi:MAG: hypothetical protein HQM10_20195 [Candidatus Riflebacteria bacterium]|nr:hypothetical protein [Candidatus Riflebacteria bacterium]